MNPNSMLNKTNLRFFMWCVVALALAVVLAAVRGAEPVRVTVNLPDGSTWSGTLSPTTAPATPVTPSEYPATLKPFLGVNLGGMYDWNRTKPFVNVIKFSRKWGTARVPWDSSCPVDASGNPTTDCGTLIFTDYPAAAVAGMYSFSCTGKATVGVAGPAVVASQGYDAASNTTRASIQINGGNVQLILTGTNGGVKDVVLLQPGYKLGAVYGAQLTNALSPFNAIRFMDWLHTNNSTLSKWSDRPKPTDSQYTGPFGVPYEVCIDLGNVTGKDVWINVPSRADDDFIKNLGELVRSRLDKDRVCYVEFSNEVWNGQFTQYKDNFDAAQAELAAGDTLLNYDGANNPWYNAWRRVAKRAVRIKQLMGPNDSRIRVVLASQLGYNPPGWVAKVQLEYVVKAFGEPSKYIFAIAGAPYFSPGETYVKTPGVTVDGIINGFLNNTGSTKSPEVQGFHALAKQYHLFSFAYECGADMYQYPNDVPVKIASQTDPRMGQAVEQYLRNWYDGGGVGAFYFSLDSKYDQFGVWGLFDDVSNYESVKYKAASGVAKSLPARPAAVR